MFRSYIVFGDLHYYEHMSEFLDPSSDENLFAKIAKNALMQIRSYAINNVGSGETICLGDLGHVRNRITVRLASDLIDILADWPGTMFVLRGNPRHDGAGDQFVGRLFGGIRNIVSIDSPRAIEQSLFVPYDTKENMLAAIDKYGAGKKILFVHAPLKGAKVLSYEAEEKDSFTNKEVRGFSYVFAGHYHMYQKVFSKPAAYQVGSPYRISFAEANDRKGFLHVLDYGKEAGVKFIELDVPGMAELAIDLPIAKTIVYDDVKGKLVKVFVRGIQSELRVFNKEAVASKLLSEGALAVRFAMERIEELGQVREARISYKEKPEEMLNRYLDYVDKQGMVEGLDLKKLAKIGHIALRNAIAEVDDG